MKKALFVIIALVITLAVHAQTSKDEYKAMIDSAINIKYNQYKQATKNQTNTYYLENLYLLNEQNLPLDYLPSSSKFKAMSVYDDRNRKVLSNGIYAWKVLTALNTNKLKITIIDFYITYKKHNYSFRNGGGSEAVFEYDCGKGIWKLVSFETKGN
ncbi:hypothetical protein SNE25_13230 [Mucilaginibacter sabulilitoris]|uniref:Nuclear transport factor 2 family protein n=1 Tax=Mucilaginibacter sabulilitoris TaxID=1173583 RepID=A0ABZ0TXE6_9SPHI|nr:hypothetical protein [Mucilaginibacter sabulilitoris]WPU96484.1 hypothetical protein SNE25_13230 [Mucilaginibacter sabulilitoris]